MSLKCLKYIRGGLLYIPIYTYIPTCVSSYIYYSTLYLIDSDTINKFEIHNKRKEMTADKFHRCKDVYTFTKTSFIDV